MLDKFALGKQRKIVTCISFAFFFAFFHRIFRGPICIFFCPPYHLRGASWGSGLAPPSPRSWGFCVDRDDNVRIKATNVSTRGTSAPPGIARYVNCHAHPCMHMFILHIRNEIHFLKTNTDFERCVFPLFRTRLLSHQKFLVVEWQTDRFRHSFPAIFSKEYPCF